MKEREWLAMQGLAIAGARGKFSHKAKAALAKARADGIDIESMTYQSTDTPTVKKSTSKPVFITSKVQRTETVAWALDKSTKPGMTDLIIAISNCGGCSKSISRCTHDVPLLPSWLGGGEALLVKPV